MIVTEADAPPLTEAEFEQRFSRDLLLDFAEMSRDFGRLLLDTAKQAVKHEDVLRLAAAFDRAGRCCRRALLLARHLQKPIPEADPERRRRNRAQKRAAIIRTVEDAIAGAKLDPVEQSGRQSELRERLDSLDLDADLTRRPISDIVDEIKRDLGLVFDELSKPIYKRRTPEDIARLQALAAKPTPPPPDPPDP